jgi:hypothetical protein
MSELLEVADLPKIRSYTPDLAKLLDQYRRELARVMDILTVKDDVDDDIMALLDAGSISSPSDEGTFTEKHKEALALTLELIEKLIPIFQR